MSLKNIHIKEKNLNIYNNQTPTAQKYTLTKYNNILSFNNYVNFFKYVPDEKYENIYNFNYDYNEQDILNSEINVCNVTTSYNENLIYLMFKQKDDDDDEYIRFAKYNIKNYKYLKENQKITKENNGFLSRISNKKIFLKNIIKKDNEDLISHFSRIIESMECDISLKEILIKRLFGENTQKLTINEKTPILYLDEKTNKKVWIIPSVFTNEDIILDYETEIPYFENGFDYFISSTEDKKNGFVSIKKSGLDSYILNPNVCDKYEINELPKNLVLDTKKTGDNNFFAIEEYKNKLGKVSYIYIPEISTIENNETLKLFKMMNIKEDIKETLENIKQYYSQENNKLKENYILKKINNKKIEKLSFNITFISKNFYIVNEKTNNNKLTNIHVYYKESNEKKVYISFNELIIKSGLIENASIEKNYFINIDEGITENKILLPKRKGILFNNEIYVDNVNNMFDYNCCYCEGTYFYMKNNSDYDKNFILDLGKEISFLNIDEVLKFNTTKYVKKVGAKKEYILLHISNGDLILINILTKEFKTIDNTKELSYFSIPLKKIMSLKDVYATNQDDYEIFLTDNKTLYFETKSKLNEEIDKTLNYYEINKSKDGNYIFDFILPISSINDKQKYSNKVLKNIEYTIKNNKLNLLVYNNENNEKDESYYFINMRYFINNEVLNENNDKNVIENGIISIKINNITLDNNESKIFIQKMSSKEIKEFNMKNNNNTNIIEIIDKKSEQKKLLLIKNNDVDFSLVSFIKNNLLQEELIKLYIKNKILKKIYNKKSSRYVFSSGNTLYLTKNRNIEIEKYDFSLKETMLNNKINILNNQDSLLFSKNNNIFEFKCKNEKIDGVSNLTLKNNINYDISI